MRVASLVVCPCFHRGSSIASRVTLMWFEFVGTRDLKQAIPVNTWEIAFYPPAHQISNPKHQLKLEGG